MIFRPQNTHSPLENTLSTEFSFSTFILGCAVTILYLAALTMPVSAQAGSRDKLWPNLLTEGADVRVIFAQPDGKVLVGGRFTTVGAAPRHDLIRLNTNGTVDESFDAGSATGTFGWVFSLAAQPDGKILVAGYFNSFNDVSRRSLVRLNPDGSLDGSFGISGLDVTFAFDVDIQSDGKILATASNLIGSSFVARFTSTGANDGGTGEQFFNLSGANGFRISYLPIENKILTTALVFGVPYQGIATRIATTGGMDNSFNLPIGNSSNSYLLDNKLLGNGKYLIFGKFETINSMPRRNIAIVNPDGTVDPTFVPDTASSGVILAADVQADGKIVIGGSDFLPNGPLHGNLGRLNANGSIDTSFNPGRGANLSVKALQVMGNRLFVGGDLFRYDRYPVPGLVRVRL